MEETTLPGFSKIIRKDLLKKQEEKNWQWSFLGMEGEEEVVGGETSSTGLGLQFQCQACQAP